MTLRLAKSLKLAPSASSQFLDSEELDLIAEAIYQTIDDDIIHAKGGLSSRNAKLVRPTKRDSEPG